MRVKLVRNEINGNPANSQIGRHVVLTMGLHAAVEQIASFPYMPGGYADAVSILEQLANENGVKWEAVSKEVQKRFEEYGSFSMCKVAAYNGDNDGNLRPVPVPK